ncbi:Clock-controlled pheromone ccg-4-like protein [Cladobotryum mycophilum]|uniref:Clock-controlled pheromone ccg-4-like protein n=1 Tax=Cladobotryum mycophilum TaxID=491253 RepID=A0ABR0SI24_9HYPO
MKLIITAIAFYVSLALATPNPAPWCFRVSQGCWKVKRTVETFVDSVKKSDLPVRSDDSTGFPNVEIGDLDSFNNLASFLALASGDHHSVLKDLPATTPEPETHQNDKREDAEKKSLEVLPNEKRWCFRVSQGCWKAKRDVQEESDGLTAEKRWCSRVPEKACAAVKEVTRAILDTVGEEDEAEEAAKREAAPWCFHVGAGCWKAKRDLDTIRASAKHILAGLE